MANANLLKTRLLQRIDTLENWQTSNPVLLKGEMAVAILGETTTTNKGLGGDTTKTPIVATKYGDGINAFNDLAWSQSCAADVASFIKSITDETKFNELVDARITNADLASNDSLSALAVRVTTNEGDIASLKAVCIEGTNSNEALRAAINSTAATAKTQAETAETNAKSYADEKASAAQSAAEATAAADATAKVSALESGAVKANADAIDAIEVQIGSEEIGATVTAAIKSLQDSVGSSGTNSLGSRVDTLEGEMDTAQADIIDLKGRMTTAEDEIDALQSVTAGYTGANAIQNAVADAKKAGTDAADAVAAEKTRAEAAESGLSERIAKAEAFLADANLDTENGNVIDTLKEIQDYITSDQSGATEMLASIQQNKNDIATNAGNIANNASAITELQESVGDLDDKADGIAARVTAIENAPYATTANVATAKSEAIAAAVGESGDASSANTIYGAKAYADAKASAAQAAAATDATTKANQALADAKTYTDGKISTVSDEIGAVKDIATAGLTESGSGVVGSVAKNTSTGEITVTKRAVGAADMSTTDVFVFYCGEASGYSLSSVDI